jgi:anti-sigma-K factor RskA
MADEVGRHMEALSRDELLGLIPACALGALDPHEAAALEVWLPTDAEGQALLADYQALTGQLYVLAPARAAPRHLGADLQARLAAGREQRAKPAKGVLVRRRPVRVWLAAAATLVVVVAALLMPRLFEEAQPALDDPRQLYAHIVAQAGAQRFVLEASEDQPELRGELAATSAGDQAVIRVEQLPVLVADQTFQLWLLDREGTLRSGGIFAAGDDATYVVVPLEQPLLAYERFGVSIEPAGGSPYADRPTGPPVFRVYTNS